MAITRQGMEEEVDAFPAPSVVQVMPDYGKAGDVVTIRGEHMASVTGCTITVGPTSKPGRITDHIKDGELKVRIPEHLPTGNGHIRVSNEGGESNQLSFTIQS